MRLSAEDAIIEPRKLSDYLLWEEHPDGRSKARYLAQLGYERGSWTRLADDLRQQILVLDARHLSDSRWGSKYEILGLLRGPNGRAAGIRSIWIMLPQEGRPRFVTLTPWKEP